ncbi:presenilins-associated rhomboid-like protein, mitochondrial [Mizuhopecten yessoensis]|uniref:rhomboid protease n=1 Tax=Mizuhopecten yessoensis TaxID=6573 RepID=A0A210Q6W7_MIZYE|nr:presenilins-associated rhomboid-like protein, mitochondrial [Mizuhopecten yessoensis]OWF44429.1 Presenilins-associated rhomboid-like protein, mitochondrial [Mizuhopecten yessoensis]
MAAPVRLLSCLRVCRVNPVNNGGLCHFNNMSTQCGRAGQVSSKFFGHFGLKNVHTDLVLPGRVKLFALSNFGGVRRTFSSKCSLNAARIRHRNLPAKQLLQHKTHRCQPPRRTFKSKLGSDGAIRGGFKQSKPKEGLGRGGDGAVTLVKSFAFTAGVCVCSFTGCMIWCYEDVRSQARRFERHLRTFSADRAQKIGFRQDMDHIWSQIPPGHKLVAGIIAANIAVFMLWKVPSFASTMERYFLLLNQNPRISMLLSSFSHMHLVHISINMYVFWSFKDIASKLGREQFMAVYLSAGVVSCLFSQINKVARVIPIGSLGASGAIMAIFGMLAHMVPEARLHVPFVSMVLPHSFSMDTGVKFILCMDTLGLILGWRRLDHAAHLGGLLFGYLYARYGRELIWNRRYLVINKWRKFRE